MRSKSKKHSKKKADKWFSIYKRLENASPQGLCRCITCGRAGHWKNFDNGHFILRDKEATRYDPRNAHAQCKNCNRFRSGEQYKHSQYIAKTYGEEELEELETKAKMGGLMKRTQVDYEYIADYYRQKAKELAKQKGLEI